MGAFGLVSQVLVYRQTFSSLEPAGHVHQTLQVLLYACSFLLSLALLSHTAWLKWRCVGLLGVWREARAKRFGVQQGAAVRRGGAGRPSLAGWGFTTQPRPSSHMQGVAHCVCAHCFCLGALSEINHGKCGAGPGCQRGLPVAGTPPTLC